MNASTHYDLLIDENNDPFRDPPALKAYMDKWDGKTFIDAMKLDKSKNVLEIGIGTGRLAAKVAADCRHLVGIDISARSIERAKENLNSFGNITYICSDFNSYGFTEVFDVIYSSLTMMHFEDKKQVISKVEKLLNKGGIFCISIDKNQSEYIDMGTRKLKIYPDTSGKITALINETGMTVESIFETDNAYIIVSVKAL